MDLSAGAGPPVFVMDASAVVHGANVAASSCVTVAAVVAEFKPGGATHRRLEQLLAAGLDVREPSSSARDRVASVATAAGSLARLSSADRDTLAVCLDLGPNARLLSDDFTMLDLAKRLGIDAQAIATQGVRETLDWAARCAGCGRTFSVELAGTGCPVCGSEIRAKPRRRR